jgi:hypothetical protein
VQSLTSLFVVQVEGQPVQRPTVVAYLNSAYQHAYGEPFRDAPQLQHDEPAARHSKKRKLEADQQPGNAGQPALPEAGQQQQAPAQAAAGVTTFAAMTQLLLFADAVGSTAPLLRACAAGIDKLCLHVQLPAGVTLDLSIRTLHYWDTSDSSSPKLSMVTEQQQGLPVATFSAADFASVKAALVQQVQAQTEALLYTAYKLQLSEVAEAVQDFICMQASNMNSVLRGCMRPVLSQRVMDAAAGYRSLHETLLLNHLVTRPCSFASPTQGAFPIVPKAFAPIDLPAEQKPLTFTAEAVQDAFGSSKGQQLPAEVNLFSSTIRLGRVTYRAHVVVGPMVCNEEAKQEVLGPPAPAAD